MNIMSKLRDLLTVPEDDEEDAAEDIRSGAEADADAPALQQRAEPKTTGHKIVSFQTSAQIPVFVTKAEKMEDSKEIAEQLSKMHTVILSLESTNKEIGRRLLDFLAGVAYAYKGQIKQIAKDVYLIAPFNVSIMGDLLTDLQSEDEGVSQIVQK